MVRRLLLAEQNIVKADDRDFYGNKRMQLGILSTNELKEFFFMKF